MIMEYCRLSSKVTPSTFVVVRMMRSLNYYVTRRVKEYKFGTLVGGFS